MQIDSFCPVGIGGTCQLDTSKLKIFVGNLPLEYRSKDLFSIFVQYGTIREAVVIPDRFRVRSRCYGFVTFATEESVEKVFNCIPIETENRRLTIILACKNAKPRRAHFNVRHGTSGHRPLPAFPKEYNHAKNEKQNVVVNNENESKENKKSIANGSTNINLKDSKEAVPKIYNDPSLFRTANIQPITPACIDIPLDNSKKMEIKNAIRQEFPNEDIEKDFERSLRIKENKNKNKNKNENQNQVLDYIQIRKDKRHHHSQSKDATENVTWNRNMFNNRTKSISPIPIISIQQNNRFSPIMSNELMTSYSMVSNPMTCYSGSNQIGDSVATMISYRS